MSCAWCGQLLRWRQRRFCSEPCYRQFVRNPASDCAGCGCTFHPQSRGRFPDGSRRRMQRYCSLPCYRRIGRFRLEVVAILRANVHAWLTLSDLAIWAYGDDGPSEIDCVRSMLWRLRLAGYGLEHRTSPAQGSCRRVRAYRLVAEPASRARTQTA